MNTFKSEPEVKWSSFMPALGYALAASSGPVLELGVGHFSTPFLHAYCKAAGRALVSVEADKSWGEMFLGYESHFHHVRMEGYDAFLKSIPDQRFGVSFIDNSPGGLARSGPFENLITRSEYVVVHDYHRENYDCINPLVVKYGAWQKVYSVYDPPTLIASVCKEIF